MESFPSCGNNLFFLRKLTGAFLGLSSAADAARPAGAGSPPLRSEAAGPGAAAGGAEKAGLAFHRQLRS